MPSYYDPREETTPFSLFAKEYQILRQGKEDEEQQQMEKAKTYAQLSTLPIKIAEGYRTGELAETNQLLSIKDKDYVGGSKYTLRDLKAESPDREKYDPRKLTDWLKRRYASADSRIQEGELTAEAKERGELYGFRPGGPGGGEQFDPNEAIKRSSGPGNILREKRRHHQMYKPTYDKADELFESRRGLATQKVGGPFSQQKAGQSMFTFDDPYKKSLSLDTVQTEMKGQQGLDYRPEMAPGEGSILQKFQAKDPLMRTEDYRGQNIQSFKPSLTPRFEPQEPLPVKEPGVGRIISERPAVESTAEELFGGAISQQETDAVRLSQSITKKAQADEGLATLIGKAGREPKPYGGFTKFNDLVGARNEATGVARDEIQEQVRKWLPKGGKYEQAAEAYDKAGGIWQATDTATDIRRATDVATDAAEAVAGTVTEDAAGEAAKGLIGKTAGQAIGAVGSAKTILGDDASGEEKALEAVKLGLGFAGPYGKIASLGITAGQILHGMKDWG